MSRRAFAAWVALSALAPPAVALPLATTPRSPHVPHPPSLAAPHPPSLAAPRPRSLAAPRRTAAGSACQHNTADSLSHTGGASQLVLVVAPSTSSTTASVTIWRRSRRSGPAGATARGPTASCFVAAGGPWLAEVGVSGLSSHHTEGDGTTPIGAFPIEPVMYGVDPDPGVAYPYHRLVCGDWWDEDPSSPAYNRFVHLPCGESPPFGGNSEALWTEAPDYDWLAVVAYNVDPTIPGRGSGIFLHLSTGIPTTGCVALALAPLLTTLRWLRPAAHPLVVIGTARGIDSE
ncbi:MAG TPA: L,D-transpeptidase family protein [Acidimicrobiales bacterium]|nr:L,D-transpeptidase family protein [Acidimicrobiales bacterium]